MNDNESRRTIEMTWRQTATDNIMNNEETPKESRCLPLTSIDLFGVSP
ncbi:MAG: hypothetical protein ACR2MG_04685 [Pyrinomonadaceae bacterium]